MARLFLLILFLGSPSTFAKLLPQVAARLASLQNEGGGTPVSEALLRQGDHPGTALEQKLREISNSIIAPLDSSVREAPWNDVHMGIDGPSCFDAAPKFGLLLRALELPGYVAAKASHVFYVVESAEANLLIDPTIRQYFGQDSAPAWVPKIFVGTLSELKALYEREPGLPVLPYQEIYFDPAWPATRNDSKMLQQRDRLLYSPESREYAPLAQFLNERAARWIRY